VEDHEEEEDEEEKEEEEVELQEEKKKLKNKKEEEKEEDDDEEEGEEGEIKQHKKRTASSQNENPPEEIPTVAELNSIRLSRDKLEKWVEEPFFTTTSPGFFVRIGIGLGRKGRRVYRVAQITKVEEGNGFYNLGSKKTNFVLKLAHGSNEKAFRLEYVSNQDFTPTEFTKWVQTMNDEGVKIIRRSGIEEKLKQLNEIPNFVYTLAAVKGMLQKKKKNMKPVNIAREKALLAAKRGEALDDKTKQKIDDKLKRLEELAKADSDKNRVESKIKVADINRKK